MEAAQRWVGRTEALDRLGVKAQTLYAYVSRGRVGSRTDPDNPRLSQYDAEDIARLVTRANAEVALDGPAHVIPFFVPSVRGEATVRSTISVVAREGLYYRGEDVVALAAASTVEDVARLLWDAGATNPFAGLGPRRDPAAGVTARTRLFASLARRAEEDRPSSGRDAADVRAEAASVLNDVIDAVSGPGPRLFFHQRLGRVWKVLERDSTLIRHALVLAMDHGLNPAVIATRAAAGGGASPAGAALAGLATFTASPKAFELGRIMAYVIEARRDPHGAAARHLTTTGAVPGFGDPAWAGARGDPRAASLLKATALPADLSAVVREGQASSGQPPAFGLALALIARRLDLPRDGAADLLLIGRLVGLLAHALDQIRDGSPIPARLRYVGPLPGDTQVGPG
ncbi:citrate/2-methylcitrate synthase [soil metagenome]